MKSPISINLGIDTYVLVIFKIEITFNQWSMDMCGLTIGFYQMGHRNGLREDPGMLFHRVPPRNSHFLVITTFYTPDVITYTFKHNMFLTGFYMLSLLCKSHVVRVNFRINHSKVCNSCSYPMANHFRVLLDHHELYV